jgi:DNA polymerase III subunit delta
MLVRAEDFIRDLPQAEPAALYLITGDEPLQVCECQDALRRQCRLRGFDERSVFDADINLNWEDVQTELGSPSLFAQQRIIEIRLQKRTPGTDGAKVLMAFCEQASPIDVIIMSMDKADKKTQQSAWFKALDQHGVIVQIWPPLPAILPQWLATRAKRKGLILSNEAAVLLAERTEGNLLAADQELERLALICEHPRIDVEQVLAGTVENARYDVFAFMDSALAGDPVRALRILRGLRAEGTEAVLVNWALTRELRGLYLHATKNSAAANNRRTASYSTTTRQKLLAATLRRHTSADLRAMLLTAGGIDQIIKGARPGSPWSAFMGIAAWLAGGSRPVTWNTCFPP